MFTEPGSAREEAERLVAAGLAFASLAANAHPEIATGSAACCVCPFCKLIDAVRDPDPQVVERIATGAGDLAVGLAGLLRGLSSMARPAADSWAGASEAAAGNGSAGERSEGRRSPGAGFETAGGSRFAAAGSEDAATAHGAGFETAGSGGFDSSAAAPPRKVAKKTVAKKVAKKAVAKKAVANNGVPRIVPDAGTAAGPHDGVETALTQPKPLAKKAVAKKAIKSARPQPSPGASG